MRHRTLFARIAFIALGACALLSACGGRYQAMHEVADGDAAGGAGRGSSNTAGRGGAPFSGNGGAGTSGGAVGIAGTGGGGGCGAVICNAPNCPLGATLVTLPGACCPTCSACPGTCSACAPGKHAQMLAGSCCPACVDDSDAACVTGRKAYWLQRDEYLNKYSYGCASSNECVLLAPMNRCEQGCSYTTVWYGAADSFESNLSMTADMYCSSCVAGPIPSCTPPPKPLCFNGRCTL